RLRSCCVLSRLARSGADRPLPSFPTRRSSDLPLAAAVWGFARVVRAEHPAIRCTAIDIDDACTGASLAQALLAAGDRDTQLAVRSEEHTSELQSRENLVCRLLLEKKKTIRQGQ